jgi:hypothetical protein
VLARDRGRSNLQVSGEIPAEPGVGGEGSLQSSPSRQISWKVGEPGLCGTGAKLMTGELCCDCTCEVTGDMCAAEF